MNTYTAAMVFVLTAGLYASPADLAPPSARNERAVREVQSGKRTVANAAWWGFQSEDSTETLQAAFDSGAKTVIVPFMGRPWIVRPLKLHSNQEVIFEPGVVILVKKGEFRARNDSLFTAADESNITLRGYGAILRMRKKDYQNPPYEKAEWRMGIAIRGCRNVLIEGLRVESTGGDGIYIDGGGSRKWSENVTIRNCVSDDNHRQGISVISAVNLLVENCVFSNTSGTAPEAGIDLEPDAPDQRLVNCVIRNCVFENNRGNQMLVYLKQFNGKTQPVSIRFENCLARGGGWSGMTVGAIRDEGPKGLVEFINCTAENSGKEGVRVYNKSAMGALVRFVNCSWSNSWLGDFPEYKGPRVPVLINLRDPKITQKYGGVEFLNCYVFDHKDRPALEAFEDKTDFGVRDLRGEIFVRNPSGVRKELGPHPASVTVKVVGAGD